MVSWCLIMTNAIVMTWWEVSPMSSCVRTSVRVKRWRRQPSPFCLCWELWPVLENRKNPEAHLKGEIQTMMGTSRYLRDSYGQIVRMMRNVDFEGTLFSDKTKWLVTQLSLGISHVDLDFHMPIARLVTGTHVQLRKGQEIVGCSKSWLKWIGNGKTIVGSQKWYCIGGI